MWLETFNEMRKNSGMSLDEISVKSGVPKGTLAKITSGITKAPPLETMRKLVYSMGYTLDDLDSGLKVSERLTRSEKDHIKKYRLLDSHGKEMVDLVLDKETERMELESTARKEQEAMEAGRIGPPAPTPPIAGQPYPELDLAAQVTKLERQNQELAAEIAAMREQERKMPQEMTDEELRAELDRQLLEEKIRAENGVVSGPTNSDTATG